MLPRGTNVNADIYLQPQRQYVERHEQQRKSILSKGIPTKDNMYTSYKNNNMEMIESESNPIAKLKRDNPVSCEQYIYPRGYAPQEVQHEPNPATSWVGRQHFAPSNSSNLMVHQPPSYGHSLLTIFILLKNVRVILKWMLNEW